MTDEVELRIYFILTVFGINIETKYVWVGGH